MARVRSTGSSADLSGREYIIILPIAFFCCMVMFAGVFICYRRRKQREAQLAAEAQAAAIAQQQHELEQQHGPADGSFPYSAEGAPYGYAHGVPMDGAAASGNMYQYTGPDHPHAGFYGAPPPPPPVVAFTNAPPPTAVYPPYAARGAYYSEAPGDGTAAAHINGSAYESQPEACKESPY